MPPIAFRISGIDTTLTKERSTRRSRREETKVAVTSAHNNNKMVSESGESNISQIMDVERRIEIVHINLPITYMLLLEMASTVSLAALGMGVPGPNTAATPLSYKNW